MVRYIFLLEQYINTIPEALNKLENCNGTHKMLTQYPLRHSEACALSFSLVDQIIE